MPRFKTLAESEAYIKGLNENLSNRVVIERTRTGQNDWDKPFVIFVWGRPVVKIYYVNGPPYLLAELVNG